MKKGIALLCTLLLPLSIGAQTININDQIAKDAIVNGSTTSMDTQFDLATDSKGATEWNAEINDLHPWYTINVKKAYHLKTLMIKWSIEQSHGVRYKIYTSKDRQEWNLAHLETQGDGYTDYITLNTPAQFVKIVSITKSNDAKPLGIRELAFSGSTMEAALKNKIKVQYRCGNIENETHTLNPHINIKNESSFDISLHNLKARYWYSRESLLSSESILTNAVQLPNWAINSALGDGYVDISFSKPAGTLPANGETDEIELTLYKEDYSEYKQEHDYSFDPSQLTMSDFENITLYYKGELIWGVEKPLNILFLGNSFTFRHDLAHMVKELLEEGNPNRSVHVDSLVYGGRDMYHHSELYGSELKISQHLIDTNEIVSRLAHIEYLESPDASTPPQYYFDYFHSIRPFMPDEAVQKNWTTVQEKQLTQVSKNMNRLKHDLYADNDYPQTLSHRDSTFLKKIVQWDYVVLQSWNDIKPDFKLGYGTYASQLAEIAQTQGTNVILYLPANITQNAASVKDTIRYDQTRQELASAIKLADSLHIKHVVPVGLAIAKIQEGGTDYTFRYVTDFHPNQRSAFLAANMFYTALTKKSTEGFSFSTVTETKVTYEETDIDSLYPKGPDGNNATVEFKDSEKSILQGVAYESIMDFDTLAILEHDYSLNK